MKNPKMQAPINSVPPSTAPQTFSAPLASDEGTVQQPPKPWPHAPVHRLTVHGIYIVTAGTLHKQDLFERDDDRTMLEKLLLILACKYQWQIEAWAVFSNHYHFVARGNPSSANLRELIRHLHSDSARELNRVHKQVGRVVWYNFWDTRLTYQYAYLARLNYVHQNAVKHGLVRVANQYQWCSARWFERVASPAQVQTIYAFKTDRVKVQDDF